MKVLKVINNNVVSALDDRGKEIVIMGKGVGFGKKQGELIEENRIEKKFSMPGESMQRFETLLSEIPYEHIQTANKIIAVANDKLGIKLNKNVYITLTDHLNFAITRIEQGIIVENALLWEIKKFYQQEFQIGLEALKIIKENLGVELPEDEAGFFALHLVNAEMGADMHQTMNVPGVIKDIMNIVSYTFAVDIDSKSVYYDRFVTHLKFFLGRAVRNETYRENIIEGLTDMIKNGYPKSYRCALRIRDYIRARLKYEVSDEEVTYMAIHIERMVTE